MSFGTKLADLPVTVPPGGEIVATFTFITPGGEMFEQHATIYVEEATGIRPLEITVKSAPRESSL